MADERIVLAVKIVDSGTNQAAAVTSADGLEVNTELPTPVALAENLANPTPPAVGAFGMLFDGATWDRAPGDSADGALVNLGTNNDVTVTGAVDTELPAAVALADNTANPTVPAVGAFGMVFDGTTWDRMLGDQTDGVLVNLGTNNDVTTELPAAAALADATANPTVPGVGSFMMGFNGTTWDRVRTANTGRLQVDVITGGGAETPTTPVRDSANSTNTAAGSSADLDSSEQAGNTKKLAQVTCSASVAWKAIIQAAENAIVVETYDTIFGRAGETVQWKPPHRDYADRIFATTAGFDGWRITMTNLDTAEAADLYTTIYHED